ncbi:EamA-like transporter family protein [Rhizobiales bacterium GAS191]|jgi:drug/metabolite transporter (DMT)-like permease|nr:EamA-like transporter family protein [Rhizobiales bacterium GAS113]SEE19974.1 EamA-like transporter family protein [Rhizobiales bacterium GAS188]SEE36847.1 EamA-like transporter family protein [Rhizobiales bacterium GAS191]
MHLDLTVFLAVLTAAALHAGWNALIKIRLDPFLAMTLICFACGVIALPALLVTGLPKAAAWPWIIASVAIHLGYYLFLAEAYRRADMGQIYPIARGAAPLMTAVVSLFVVHDPISLGNGLGIALLGCGVLLISLRGHRHLVAPSRIAISCALLTAVTIAAYTIVDGIGARVAGDANAYAAALFTVDAYPMLLLCLWWKGVDGIKPVFGFLAPGFAGGAMSLAAYWIAIWAMTVAPIALVAAIRETSILFAGLIAVIFLKEPMTRVRAASAALILGGLVCMRVF